MRLSLFPTVEAPGEARRAVADLGERIGEASLADLRTVLSELVTLSVVHGASKPIEVNIELAEEDVEAVFDDHGPAARTLVRAMEREESSLPLQVIGGMVDEWEAIPEETGIWFRMRVRTLRRPDAGHS
jgi:anti-sigma regulatory factor (Ser/Thr protein kinase)